ncbi:MAG TPA: dipeptidyl carboxypeptidase II, partial [Terriglobales bacterium]|nr:dipeptidyl carboxypeptidase II [Terriglobales bacterium]
MNTSISSPTTAIILLCMSIVCPTASAQNSSNQPSVKTFGPSNPFYAPSTLPFQAPPLDKIKDEDFQPAIEAGIAQQETEVESIADNPEPPTFENTIIAMEKSGELLDRVMAVFGAITSANTNPTLQDLKMIEAPKLAAHEDFIYLNPKLFRRVAEVYQQRASHQIDPESLRLVERYYEKFVHAGANLSEADKTELKKLNEEA